MKKAATMQIIDESIKGKKRIPTTSAEINFLSSSVSAFLSAINAVCDVPKFTKMDKSTLKDSAMK